MTRHKIGANTAIFQRLDEYCRLRGTTLANEKKPRWIESGRSDQDFLVRSVIQHTLSVSTRRKLAWAEYAGESFLFTVGFGPDSETEVVIGLREIELRGGHLTTALFELSPSPTADISAIRNIVEVSDLEADPTYRGHDSERIRELFPSVRLFAVLNNNAPWNTFFRLCLRECRASQEWLSDDLFGLLDIVAELDETRIPYRVLCRSIFDSDPSSFFLALYRCLEALFAFSSAKDVVGALGLQQDWATVATVLEEKLGWWPHEEASLERLFKLVIQADLAAIADAIDPSQKIAVENNVLRQATGRVYKLRNAIVHYRPSHHSMDLAGMNWAEICASLAVIVLHVYVEVFP